jgi:hypothetical protein
VADNDTDEGCSLTIKQFCVAENMAECTFYKLQKLGLTPETIVFPGTRIVRITARARRQWHERMLELSRSRAAKREHERRVELARRAGAAAAASPRHISRQRGVSRKR